MPPGAGRAASDPRELETILLVDPDKIARSIAQEMLEGFGYGVESCSGEIPEANRACRSIWCFSMCRS